MTRSQTVTVVAAHGDGAASPGRGPQWSEPKIPKKSQHVSAGTGRPQIFSPSRDPYARTRTRLSRRDLPGALAGPRRGFHLKSRVGPKLMILAGREPSSAACAAAAAQSGATVAVSLSAPTAPGRRRAPGPATRTPGDQVEIA